MNANVQELIEEGGAVRGVRYIGSEWQKMEVRALLTIGADGRFSRVRHLADFEPIKQAPPMDVLSIRLPRDTSSADEGSGEPTPRLFRNALQSSMLCTRVGSISMPSKPARAS